MGHQCGEWAWTRVHVLVSVLQTQKEMAMVKWQLAWWKDTKMPKCRHHKFCTWIVTAVPLNCIPRSMKGMIQPYDWMCGILCKALLQVDPLSPMPFTLPSCLGYLAVFSSGIVKTLKGYMQQKNLNFTLRVFGVCEKRMFYCILLRRNLRCTASLTLGA